MGRARAARAVPGAWWTALNLEDPSAYFGVDHLRHSGG